MIGGGGWKCLVSFFKIEVKASAGCAVCSKILANIAHENGYDDEQGNRVPNFDVTTWPSIGCGAPFKSRTKSGKRRMACVLRIKQGGKEINVPSIVPPPDVLHALNKCMSLPKDWEMQTPRMLQEATIPMFPTTWKCGPPYDFIGRFQTEDWIKRRKPYVSEKGWSNILMVALRGVSPNLSPEEVEKMDSIIKTADDLEKEWQQLLDEEAAEGADNGLHIEEAHTAEERCIARAREVLVRRDKEIHPWNYHRGHECTGELVKCGPAQTVQPPPPPGPPPPPAGSRKDRVMADLDNEAVQILIGAEIPYDWIGGRYEKPRPPKWKR